MTNMVNFGQFRSFLAKSTLNLPNRQPWCVKVSNMPFGHLLVLNVPLLGITRRSENYLLLPRGFYEATRKECLRMALFGPFYAV